MRKIREPYLTIIACGVDYECKTCKCEVLEGTTCLYDCSSNVVFCSKCYENFIDGCIIEINTIKFRLKRIYEGIGK